MSTRVAYEQLRAWWQAWVEHVVGIATTCASPGDARWDAVLDGLGVERLPVSERLAHVRESAQRLGPAPIEVERALRSLGEQARAAARRLQFGDGVTEDVAFATELDRFELLASRTVDDHLQRVLGALRPPVSTSSIFANAAAIKPGWGPPVAAEVATLACPNCGVPRREAKADRICSHCGTRF
jgi:hypothetical protein